jgi:hypothetical protein
VQQESSRSAASPDHVVRLAASPAERDRVYRFRYESFAAEYGRWPGPRLAARRMIRDEADEKAALFCVEADGRVVATLRLRVGPLPVGLLGPFDANRFADSSGSATALADEILVSRIFRKASLLESLLAAAEEACLANGALLLFCHARPEAVPAYRAAGYREAAVPFEHPDFGPRVPLVRFLGPEGLPAVP